MTAPRFSVLIPTRDRPATFRHTLATVAAQAGDDYEIVVADNCSGPETKRIVDECGARRVRYERSERILPMGQNWERGLALCSGEYVTVLGDDDGLVLGALPMARKVIDGTGAQLFSWSPHTYWWPDVIVEWNRSRLYLGFGEPAAWLDSRASLEQFYRGTIPFSRIPMIYNAFVHRGLIEEGRRRFGAFFVPPDIAPDIASGILVLTLTPHYVHCARALSIRGNSGKSNGTAHWARSLGAEQRATYYRDEGVRPEDVIHRSLISSPNLAIGIANIKLKCKEVYFPDDDALRIDLHDVLREMIANLNGEPEAYDDNLADARALADKLGVALDPARIPARKGVRRINAWGPSVRDGRVTSLAVNCDLAGVADVHGAARLAEGVLATALADPLEGLQKGPEAEAEAQFRRAEAALQAGDFEAAQRQFAALAQGAPRMAKAHARFAYLERQFGRIAPSLAAYRRALELDPADAEAGSGFLLALNYSDAHSREEIFAEHQRFAAHHASAAPLGPPPAGAQRLRIGYVSPDFRSHVVASFAMPILARHDRERFEVFCYYTHAGADQVTQALRALADHFVACHGDPPAALAQRIRADRIDILVDLAGHTPGNSLPAFALKPAPLQVSYLGYPNTTGLRAIDYRLTDAIADPPGDAERFHAERLARLPRGFLCYRPGPDVHDVVPLPAAHAGHVTFGCFNNFQKLSPSFFRAAQRILAGTPGSRLLLKGKPLAYRAVADAVRQDFARAGIDAARLELRGWEPAVEAHLGAYGEVDIALDSFPYNGTTTTCEALWMGAPVVALQGDRHAARVGASLLHAVGLPELLAKDEGDYVRIAVRLAGDGARLRELRLSLRERMRRSPLMDERGFVRDLESSYLGMWRAKWEDEPAPGAPPEPKLICARALLRRPGDLEAATRLWQLCNESGDHASAVEWLRRAAAAAPRTAKLHYMLGCALEDAGRLPEAIASYRESLANDPALATAANNLGCLLELSGDLKGAAPLYEQAIAADPALAHAHYNLGNLHKQLGRHAEAEKSLRAALERDPARADWACNLGEVLLQQWKLDEAEARFRAALGRDPAYAPAHNGLGIALQASGRSAEAEACFRRALESRPAYAEAHSNLLLNLHYHRGDDAPALYREHLAWPERHARALPAIVRRRAGAPDALRIGYVSPDFRRHAVASFIEPVLAAHDRRRHRIFCYANVAQPDATTARLQGLCDEWRDIRALGDDEAARRIAEDGIDVLVDLAGHTGGGRLLLFARKPAPVQANWLGYPDTTGLAAIDYRLTDRHADPEGSDAFSAEKLLRLERGFLCYGPPADAPDPAGAAPRRGEVTFGSFNNLAKVTPATLALWVRILAAVPSARLVVKAQALASQGARAHLAAAFTGAGGDARALTLLGPEDSAAAHLGRYREIDIALDTFPYHGTTTTCEALWMGVPVVTLAGPTHVSRVGASILAHAGLAELVAATPGEYVEKASSLARDGARLAALRGGLRARLKGSALLDRAGFVRGLEAAYENMIRSR